MKNTFFTFYSTATFIITIISCQTSYGMELNTKDLTPFHRPQNCEKVDYSTIKCLRKELDHERFDTCYTVAATEILGITGQAPEKLKIDDSSDIITQCNFLQYFIPTKNPTKDSLAVYVNEDNLIVHMAVVTECKKGQEDQCLVKDKWGIKTEIIEHSLFNIPSTYGNKVFFYDLNVCKTLVLEQMQRDIQKSAPIQKDLREARKQLIMLANGKEVPTSKRMQANHLETPYSKMWYLLKTHMGLSIDTVNVNGKTPLMLTAQRDDFVLMKLLLNMKASINLRDKDGNTALHLAAFNNKNGAVHTLLCYDADTTIRNKNGFIARIDTTIEKQAQSWKNILFYLSSGNDNIDFGNEEINAKNTHQKLEYVLNHSLPVNINAQEPETGETALHFAVERNDHKMVDILLNHGADRFIKDHQKFTAADYAQKSGNVNLAALLT